MVSGSVAELTLLTKMRLNVPFSIHETTVGRMIIR